MSDVVVVVPARDEESRVGAIVTDVRRSLLQARHRGLVDRVRLQVLAHRCRDRTAEVARAALRGGSEGHVAVLDAASTVGEVRDHGTRLGLERLASRPPVDAWVLSTDADTRVPVSWVADLLTAAAHHDAAAVVGVASLSGWPGDPVSHATYQALVRRRSGTEPAGALDEHDHVYGANLAVRADAYLEVGGFPWLPHDEDRALVKRLDLAGHRVLRTSAVTVTTSARVQGRAPGGLADLLASLVRPPAPGD